MLEATPLSNLQKNDRDCALQLAYEAHFLAQGFGVLVGRNIPGSFLWLEIGEQIRRVTRRPSRYLVPDHHCSDFYKTQSDVFGGWDEPLFVHAVRIAVVLVWSYSLHYYVLVERVKVGGYYGPGWIVKYYDMQQNTNPFAIINDFDRKLRPTFWTYREHRTIHYDQKTNLQLRLDDTSE